MHETLSSNRSSAARLRLELLIRWLLGGDESVFRRDDRRSSPLPFNFAAFAKTSSSLSESSAKRIKWEYNLYENDCIARVHQGGNRKKYTWISSPFIFIVCTVAARPFLVWFCFQIQAFCVVVTVTLRTLEQVSIRFIAFDTNFLVGVSAVASENVHQFLL